jgi:hypothetical protein
MKHGTGMLYLQRDRITFHCIELDSLVQCAIWCCFLPIASLASRTSLLVAEGSSSVEAIWSNVASAACEMNGRRPRRSDSFCNFAGRSMALW